ncbi:efflux RND transporter permease subunit [Hyphomonas johnsonii]|uniref:RND efflux transporter n=1 Tax=Hyphomonas johnsonii MHS-2 TaxID=1280950 RepID=A0A059FUN1_9PROT|nr:efflux RND transporter permease subunit [Hyphomonas johnsonii]KCZ94143.1 RND efflux transporter [Hyphomonas johnsonii MHS-2]
MFTIFYRLPRLAVLVMMVVVIGGLGAMFTLGRQEDPTLIERYGFVLTTLPGADAERMEALVTEPVEASLMELPEIDKVTSFSRPGVSQVSVQLSEDLTESEVDDAWTLIRQKVEFAKSQFPAGTSPPDIQRLYVGATTLVVGLVWEGEGDPPLAVMRRMALELEDRFQRLPGTELTDTYGLPKEEVRVVVDPEALSAAGLSVTQAAGLIGASDSKTPAGRLRAEGGNIGLEVGGEFDNISRIRSVPLLQRADGSAVRVSDVAKVQKGFEDPPTRMAIENDHRAILVGAFISDDQRVDVWAASAHKLVDDFAADAPPGLRIETVFDQSTYTNARLTGLAKNLVFSAGIVFVVLFFTMGWRSALVVGSAIPLTVCLVLILFKVFGNPLHQMSVTGLVISLGLLIDNAIVVVDDFDQMRARGHSRVDAINKSLRHLFAPLAASTLTTALAFAPIAMLPGGAGEFIGMIGLSVVYSITASFVISITVIPAMAGWFDRTRGWETGAPKRPRRWWRDGVSVNFISDGYRATIEAVLRFPPLGIAFGILPAIVGFILVGQLPSQFFPQTERDQFQISMQLPPEANLSNTIEATSRASEMIRAMDGVRSVTWVLGEPSPRVYYNMINNTEGVEGFASGWVQLDDNRRTRAIVANVQREMREAFPGARFLALPFEQGPPADAPIEFLIRGDDFETLGQLGDQVRTILAQTPGVTYTVASLQLGAPTVSLNADEAATALAGERLTHLAAAMNAELEGVRAGSVVEGTEELPVIVIAPNARRGTLSDLRAMTVGAGPNGAGTPLSALGEMSLDPKTAVISRRDGQRMNQILAFLDPYTLPAPVFEDYQARLAASDFQLPAGYDIRIGGEAENSGEALTNLASVGIPLILVMAGAIMLVFNSFRMMLLILTTGFLSLGLAFFGVWLFNLPFGFNAIIGGLGLLGIAINSSIVVLSLLRASPAAMADDVIAQREIVVDATRHIVATTLTTMGGFVPILLTGDAFWMPLAAGISGGVAGSALLALYFVPAVFRITTLKPIRKSLSYLFGRRQMPAE